MNLVRLGGQNKLVCLSSSCNHFTHQWWAFDTALISRQALSSSLCCQSRYDEPVTHMINCTVMTSHHAEAALKNRLAVGLFLRSVGWTSPECRAGMTWLCSLPLSFSIFPTQEHTFLCLRWSILIHPSPSRFLFLAWFLPSSLNYWDQGWPFSCGTSIIKGTASLRDSEKKNPEVIDYESQLMRL